MKSFREKLLADILEGNIQDIFFQTRRHFINSCRNNKQFIIFLITDVLCFICYTAFVAALYVDKGLRHVEVFCRVCLFPRLEVKTSLDHN